MKFLDKDVDLINYTYYSDEDLANIFEKVGAMFEAAMNLSNSYASTRLQEVYVQHYNGQDAASISLDYVDDGMSMTFRIQRKPKLFGNDLALIGAMVKDTPCVPEESLKKVVRTLVYSVKRTIQSNLSLDRALAGWVGVPSPAVNMGALAADKLVTLENLLLRINPRAREGAGKEFKYVQLKKRVERLERAVVFTEVNAKNAWSDWEKADAEHKKRVQQLQNAMARISELEKNEEDE